jgi:acyl dehydratase
MSVPDVSGKAIANLEYTEIKHLAPTFHDDTIYAESRVLEKRLSQSQPDRGIVQVETIAYNQRGQQVLSLKRRVLVPTRALDVMQQQEREQRMQQLRERTNNDK